jgi:hypothetical protein
MKIQAISSLGTDNLTVTYLEAQSPQANTERKQGQKTDPT